MQANSFKQRYTILQKVEQGSYGTVYKARSHQSGELVAVKKFKSLSKVGLPSSFIRQRYIHQILTSSRLVKVLETFVFEQEPMMVMEWLTTTLQRIVVNKKKFAIKEVFEQVVRGVLDFHSQSVVHRDLKPTNIMLKPKKHHLTPQPEPADIDTHNYQVKIIDFGMAKEVESSQSIMTNMVGSLFYRPPELLIGGKRYGKQVDIWALGCIYHYMVTGCILFKGENQLDQLKKIIEIVGLNRSLLKNVDLATGLKKLNYDNHPSNWNESLKLMNEIEFELLSKMIVMDPSSRITCDELLAHQYFT